MRSFLIINENINIETLHNLTKESITSVVTKRYQTLFFFMKYTNIYIVQDEIKVMHKNGKIVAKKILPPSYWCRP